MILTGSESSAHAFVVEPLINPKTSSFVAISNTLKHDVHSKCSIVRTPILSFRTSQSILMKWRKIYRKTETLMKCLGIHLQLANTILVTVVLNLKKHLELLKKTWRVAFNVSAKNIPWLSKQLWSLSVSTESAKIQQKCLIFTAHKI